MSGKQCWPGSDAAFCGVWSGSTLFAKACLLEYARRNSSVSEVSMIVHWPCRNGFSMCKIELSVLVRTLFALLLFKSYCVWLEIELSLNRKLAAPISHFHYRGSKNDPKQHNYLTWERGSCIITQSVQGLHWSSIYASQKTCIYNFDPFKPYIYIVRRKTGVYKGIHYFSYFCSKT